MGMTDMEMLRGWFIDKMGQAVREVANNMEMQSGGIINQAKAYIVESQQAKVEGKEK